MERRVVSAVGVEDQSRISGAIVEHSGIARTEQRINHLILSISSELVGLCIELGHIREEELYRELGYPDFTSYLSSERIHLPYKTAMNYALIGSVMIRHKQDLERIGYDPVQHGINKLRLVRGALQRSTMPHRKILDGLVSMSYRQLKRFLRNSPGTRWQQRETAARRIRVDDECILVECESGCREIVWLESDAFETEEAYRQFGADIAAVCEKHLPAIVPGLQRGE